MSTPDLAHRFAYHPPQNEATKSAHARVRAAAHEFAAVLDEVCPAGRELATALTKAEEAMMWANASVARAVPAAATPGVHMHVVHQPADALNAQAGAEVLEHVRRHTPPRTDRRAV